MRRDQELRYEAVQAFQNSLNQLEERLLVAESEDQEKAEESTKSPLPLKTDHRLPFCFSASATLSQQEFDLDSLQEAVADIDQFIERLG